MLAMGESWLMAMNTAPLVTALQAQAVANLFLSDCLPDRFTANQPYLSSTSDVWHVPVILAYPFVGSIGQVGEILISAAREEVVSYTPLEEMKRTAERLYESRRNEIETAFS